LKENGEIIAFLFKNACRGMINKTFRQLKKILPGGVDIPEYGNRSK
jgi:hypothetical protein